ncbi:hypothetical protein BX265_7576 [Streptomyces sp. TLI_235]|nr:hypothetical protein [Streptomyces sp. TLI_235]PBC70180.1 hypothetical protein BX265_7576 [Streptomyces sp. TLI_235]
MEQSFDARAVKATGGIDAGGIEARPQGPACPECGTAVRASGPGRRPVYCSRSCSSKAYRRRRAEDQHKAVTDALVASRAEIPDDADEGARELLDVAAGLQRAAAHFLENLENSRDGGPDEDGGQALDLLERSVTSTTWRLLHTARALRHARLLERRAALAAEATRHEQTATGEPAREANPEQPPVTARVEPGPVSPRVEIPGPVKRRPLHHRPAPAEAAPPAPDTTPAGSAAAQTPLRLALAAERTSVPPLARGLGTPTGTWSAEDGTLLVDGWDHDPRVLLVRRADGRPVGWVSAVGDHWGSYIDGRLVVDAADREPWLSQDALYAVSLLRMALDQHLA